MKLRPIEKKYHEGTLKRISKEKSKEHEREMREQNDSGGDEICRAKRIRSFLFRVEKEEKKNEEREKEWEKADEGFCNTFNSYSSF